MVLVEEVSVEPHAVEFVIRVRLVELLQDPQLLKTSLVPKRGGERRRRVE